MNMSNPSPVRYVTVDATNSITVDVSNRDIEKGVPGDPENCAIALAFRRTLKRKMKGVHVRVFRTTVWVAHDGADGEQVIELFNLDNHGKNLIASMDTTGLAYPAEVTIKPRPAAKSRAAIAAQNKRQQERRAKGIPSNPKYHSRGGAKGAARTLAGVRSGTSAPRAVGV